MTRDPLPNHKIVAVQASRCSRTRSAENDQERKELRSVSWLVIYSLGLACLEQRALFGTKRLSQDLLDRAEWVVGAAERLPL